MKVPRSLYHWSRSVNRDSIIGLGLTLGHPSNELDDYDSEYLCAGRSPHESWRVSGARWATEGESWDLWRIEPVLATEDFTPLSDGSEWRTYGVIPGLGVELIDAFVARLGRPGLFGACLIERDLARPY